MRAPLHQPTLHLWEEVGHSVRGERSKQIVYHVPKYIGFCVNWQQAHIERHWAIGYTHARCVGITTQTRDVIRHSNPLAPCIADERPTVVACLFMCNRMEQKPC